MGRVLTTPLCTRDVPPSLVRCSPARVRLSRAVGAHPRGEGLALKGTNDNVYYSNR